MVTAKTQYDQRFLATFVQTSLMDQMINEAHRKKITKTERGASATFKVHQRKLGSTTALSATVPLTAGGAHTSYDVVVPAVEYGKGSLGLDEGFVQVNKNLIDLTSAFDEEWAGHLDEEAHKASTAVEALARTKSVVIGGGADAPWVHPMGPDGGGTEFTSPVAHKLVRYGTQAISRAARNLIEASDKITYEGLLKAKARLLDRYAPSFFPASATEPIFACWAHPFVLTDLKASASLNSWQDVAKYIDQAAMIKRGFGIGPVGILDGMMLFSNPALVNLASGAGGIDTFPVLFMGDNFLCKVFADGPDLPDASEGGTAFNLPEGARVYAEPLRSGAHGKRFAAVSWLAYCGHGILNPFGGYRLEVSSGMGAT